MTRFSAPLAAAAVAAAVAATLLPSCCPQPLAPPQPPAPPVVVEPPAPPQPPAAPDIWAGSGIDWSKPPPAGAEAAFAPPVPQTFTVAGARVVLIENHRLPLVSVRAVFTRAGSREDGARSGLAALTTDLLVEGAGRFDRTTLPEELERLGARLETGTHLDASTLALDTLRETLEPSLALLASVIVKPRLDRGDFDRLRGDRLADLGVRPDHARDLAAIAFRRLVFAGHPYATPANGYSATVRAIKLDEVRAFWRSRFGPGDTTLVIAGDIDRAGAEAMLKKAFTGWRPAKAPLDATATVPPPGPPVLVVADRPGAPQAVVVIGRAAGAAGDPATLPGEVLNVAVGGSFISRLNARLREELGYTYGVRSHFTRARRGGDWSMIASFDTPVAVAGIREALTILDASRSAELPADELEKAILLITRSSPQDFETNAGIAGAFEELVVDGRSLDWYQGFLPGVRAVTAAAARGAGDAWKDPSVVVAGDWAKLKDGLTALGRPVVVVDGDGVPVKP